MTRFFIENYKFTIVLSGFVCLFGYGGINQINPESFPDVNLGTVIIQTFYGGASAEDIETKITKPIEDEIRTVRGLKKVQSVSQSGLSTVTTTVDIDKYDAKEVVENLQRAVDRVGDLPSDLPQKPVFIEIKSDEFPVIDLAVTGSNDKRYRDKVAYLLKEEIEDNPKVGDARLTGYRERQFNIYLKPEKLEKFHVGINELVGKIQSRNQTIPGGVIEKGNSQNLLKIRGKVTSIEDLQNLVIRSNFTGQKVVLGDLADIEDGEEDAVILASYNGKPATVVTITKKAGENLIKLSEEVSQKIDKFRKKYPDLQFEIYNNEGVRVANRISVLSNNGIIGLFLVLGFLLIFLPGRIGIMAALSLPISLFATFGAIYMMGFTLNTITILATLIAIGMLVDNAVVIAENYARLSNEGLSPKEAAVKSIADLWAPITATALTTIAAFLPMLVTTGTIGAFIYGIPVVVSVALIISLLESFFLLPMRLATGRAPKMADQQPSDWFSRYVIPSFDNLMYQLIRFRYIVLIGFIGILFGSLFLLVKGNKLDLFPAEQTEIYMVQLDMPPGTRIERTMEVANKIAVEAKELLGDDILHMATRIGDSKENPADPRGKNGDNVGIIYIFVSDHAKNDVSPTEILGKLRSIKAPEARSLFFKAAINGPPIGAPVDVTFRSDDAEQLETVAQMIKAKLASTDGIIEPVIDDIVGDDEVDFIIDYSKTAKVGLDLAQLGQTVRTAISGLDVSDINLDNREVDLFVRFNDQNRESITDLSNVKIMDRMGNLIPISQLVTFKTKPGEAQIKRFDYKRSKSVTAEIDDDVISASIANQIVAEKFAEIAKDFPDVSMKFGGEGESLNESMQSLTIALILSVVGIFALLVLVFNSFLKPLIILTTIPLGLVGFAVAFFVQGRPISFLALIGIVGLGGIIVNSGIVLISFIERMRKESDDDLFDILVKSAGLRLRAVIVTSLTTVSGLLPTAYGIGGADAFIIPMTMSLAWGLTSGTFLALLWVPCCYMIFEDFGNFFKRLIPTSSPAPPPQAAKAVST